MSRWFGGGKKQSPAIVAEEEDQHLYRVEHALLQMLNDDMVEADRILKEQDSSFHHLGRGITSFLASMLGAEKELLKNAIAILQESEAKAWADMKRAGKEPSAFRSHIYPPGTEYLLCFAISQLTSAICAVLSGSITEAIKGFYKLRKSYLTLDGIMQIEAEYLRQRIRGSSVASRPSVANRPEANGSANTSPVSSHGPTSTSPGAFDLDHLTDRLDEKHGDIHNESGDPGMTPDTASFASPIRVESRLLEVEPESVGITNHTDVFIHSGTRLCYGILLVVFSMIENPMFNRILYIVGFKGDRERGTRYIWQASRFNNFNSAIAGITLLGYYNGLVGFCDILPTDAEAADDLAGYPKGKCSALLATMRKRYPQSKLWKMEEAREQAFNRNLPEAVRILAENQSVDGMKQIRLINTFELSLSSMFLHDYELCANSWIQCSEISSWSPTLYAYLTGVTYVEMYRNLQNTDAAAAKVYKDKAIKSIKSAPPLVGKQKVMGKQLPFDLYIERKVQKWEERVTATPNADLVDVIGVSPLMEMIYFWGGVKKEGPNELQKSLDILDWSRTLQPEKHQNDLDETAIQSLLRAAVLKNMGRLDEAKETLNKEILNHDLYEFRGHLKDDWTCPMAHSEMAVIAWREKDLDGFDHTAKVLECQQWLDKTQKWPEQYVLDTRVALKISTSQLTLKRHRGIMGI